MSSEPHAQGGKAGGSKWLPSYAKKEVLDPLTGRREPAKPVTVRHVLTHTSGLSLTPTPLSFQPGERWQYGASTDYVAILVEKISGQTIDEFVRTRIFQPLGMRDTFYNIPREKVTKVAAIYRPDAAGKITLSRKPEYHEPTTYFPGVAGMNSTAADYFMGYETPR